MYNHDWLNLEGKNIRDDFFLMKTNFPYIAKIGFSDGQEVIRCMRVPYLDNGSRAMADCIEEGFREVQP